MSTIATGSIKLSIDWFFETKILNVKCEKHMYTKISHTRECYVTFRISKRAECNVASPEWEIDSHHQSHICVYVSKG